MYCRWLGFRWEGWDGWYKGLKWSGMVGVADAELDRRGWGGSGWEGEGVGLEGWEW